MTKRYQKRETQLIRKFRYFLKRRNRTFKEINFNCHSRKFMNCEFIFKNIHYRLEAIALNQSFNPTSLFWRIYKGRAHYYAFPADSVIYGILLYKAELEVFKEKLEISSIDWKIFGNVTNSEAIWLFDEETTQITLADWNSIF